MVCEQHCFGQLMDTNTKGKIAHLSYLRWAFFHSPWIFKRQALMFWERRWSLKWRARGSEDDQRRGRPGVSLRARHWTTLPGWFQHLFNYRFLKFLNLCTNFAQVPNLNALLLQTLMKPLEDASGEGEQECWFGEGGCLESSEMDSRGWRDSC